MQQPHTPLLWQLVPLLDPGLDQVLDPVLVLFPFFWLNCGVKIEEVSRGFRGVRGSAGLQELLDSERF